MLGSQRQRYAPTPMVFHLRIGQFLFVVTEWGVRIAFDARAAVLGHPTRRGLAQTSSGVPHPGPMAISLSVGKMRRARFTVRNADGTINTSLALSAVSGNATNLKVRVNPNDNREVGVMALVAGASNNATVQASLPGGVKQVQDLFSTVAASGNQEALLGGGPTGYGDEEDPTDWMLAP